MCREMTTPKRQTTCRRSKTMSDSARDDRPMCQASSKGVGERRNDMLTTDQADLLYKWGEGRPISAVSGYFGSL